MNKIPKQLLFLFSFILFAVFVWYFNSILIYLVIAWILSLIGEPVMNFFEKLRYKKFYVPRFLSAALTIISFYLVLIFFLMIFVPLVVKEARFFTNYNIEDITYFIEGPLENLDDFLKTNKIKEEGSPTSIEFLESEIRGFLNFQNVNKVLTQLIDIIGGFFVALFSVTFILFFFLKDRDFFFNMILMFTPSEYEGRVANILKKVKLLLVRYFVGIIIQISMITMLISGGLYFVGVENPLFIGLLAGIWNIVPYLGPLIGATIGVILGLSGFVEKGAIEINYYILIFQLLSVFAIVQILDNILFQPVIFSNSVKAHPMEIFLVLLIAATLAGIVGMILAIPTYTILRVISKEFFSEFKVIKKITRHL
ncbi:MAG: AI-2E family transporter [Chitinophagaceae bacterium]|nr:MAG: AI-2E family transporter [Chitinophagaceae bacterium]